MAINVTQDALPSTINPVCVLSSVSIGRHFNSASSAPKRQCCYLKKEKINRDVWFLDKKSVPYGRRAVAVGLFKARFTASRRQLELYG